MSGPLTPTQLADLLARQLIESKAKLASANSEIERLRAEVETTTGAWSRMRALHQSCESKLATARAALEWYANEGCKTIKSGGTDDDPSYTIPVLWDKGERARKALEEIK